MNLLQAAIGLQPVLMLVAGAAAALTSGRARNLLAGSACAALAAAGALAGALALAGQSATFHIPAALPVALSTAPGTQATAAGLSLVPTPLGGLFLLVAGCVGVIASVYAIGYAHGASAARSQWAALAVFLLGMQLVPLAGDVITFLLAWETMALASTVLVLADQARNAAARTAALWYGVMTHLSMVAILAGFALLVRLTGATSFAAMADAVAARPQLTDSTAAAVAFALLVLGFGAKAGLVPLHVWLPRAHPEAPSHASALMSAAMVKMGVYGLMLVSLNLLPAGPAWWALTLVTVGGLSAAYGILQAGVATDIKRLLAYSTSENIGFMVLALGLSLQFAANNLPEVADVALLAALLFVVNHAAFKTTLFLGAGAVLHATGERDLDRLGGLVHRMPFTGAAFGVGAMGAAALPLTGAFAAEWVLLQSLIHAARPGSQLLSVSVPLALAVVALTAGLALLTFVKAYGIAFLARPRSDGAAAAREVPLSMRLASLAGAAAVIALGVLPGPVAAALAPAGGIGGAEVAGFTGLRMPGVGAVLDPLALTALGAVVAVPALVATVVLARRRPRVAEAPGWGCGGIRVSPRMQYTATSYAEPLLRVFDNALQTARDVEVTHVKQSTYMAARVTYTQRLQDVVETGLYLPLIGAANRLADRARGVQNGSINRYLGFAFVSLLAVLWVVS